ncbi:MAG: xanthine phosphoribosyltransferase [Proteobacteria bacterium]|nr:xanthine phosphoribosyltransferase [Pseudomonadota bacterium]
MVQLRDDIEHHIVTWAEVHRDTRSLVRKLLPSSRWNGIVALTRGGLVPAAIVARELSIHTVDTLCITTYDEQVQGRLRVLKTPDAALQDGGAGWILVDDLVDTGTTLQEAKRILPKAHVATVYAKPKGAALVDSYVREIAQDVWMFFPWDTEPQYARPLADPG